MRRGCQYFLLFLFLGNAMNLSAQLNESDTLRFQGRVSLSGSGQKGNVDLLTIRSRLDFSIAPKEPWVFKSQNSLLYQAFSGRKADADLFSRNYLYYQPSNKLYPFLIAYVSTNFRRKIRFRHFEGLGLSYQIFNKKNQVLKLSAGTVYEATLFDGNNYNYPDFDGDNNIQLWRGTVYLGGWTYLLDRHLRVFYDAFWQPAYIKKSNFRTQIELGLDLAVWKGLSVTAFYNYTHENLVIRQVKQDDRILTWGLSYVYKLK